MQFFSICLSWCIGYVGMWAGKWVIAELFTSESSLSIAAAKIQQRSSHVNGGLSSGLISTLKENILYYRSSVIVLFVLAVLAAAVILCIKRGVKMPSVAVGLALLLCCALPIVWYMLTMEHSYTHACFTYRELSIAIYAVLSFVYICIRRRETPRREAVSNG